LYVQLQGLHFKIKAYPFRPGIVEHDPDQPLKLR
jgi:hypothetical protein